MLSSGHTVFFILNRIPGYKVVLWNTWMFCLLKSFLKQVDFFWKAF